ncbi:MAG: xanthine dehydrogenase family protein subunit M [Pseudomonadota bacterium]
MTVFYRRLPKFDYAGPKDIAEAWDLMRGMNGVDYQVFAGGTDVIPKLKRRAGRIPKCLIDLKGIRELDYISYDANGGLALGALACVQDVADSRLIREHHPALAEAAGRIGAAQIRHRATVVGNICNAAPSADTAPALLALDASVRCASAAGDRIVPLKDFFAGPLQTVLSHGEIVREIMVPGSSAGPNSCYIKLSPRQHMDLAVVGVAAFVREKDGRCEEIRIGLGSVGRTPLRAFAAETSLRNATINQESIELAARAAAEECWPRDSIRGSAAYRREMVHVLTVRAINRCLSGEPLEGICRTKGDSR